MSASLLFELLLGAKLGLDGVIRNFLAYFAESFVWWVAV